MTCLLYSSFHLNLAHTVAEDLSEGAPAEMHGHRFRVVVVTRRDDAESLTSAEHRMLVRDQYLMCIEAPFHLTQINKVLPAGTGEQIAQFFLLKLRESVLGDQVVAVQLVETRKNRFQSAWV